MNKQIQKPLIVTFYQPQEKVVSCSTKGSRVYVPVNVNWNEFTSVVDNVKENGYDSILVQVDKNVDLDQKGVVNTLNIKMSHLVKIADEQIPVLTTSGQADEEPWYLMNPTYEDQAQAHGYAPADDTVMAKYNEYEDNDAWQKHQNQIWTRMADMMPLSSSTKYGSPDHLAALTDPSRGLERSDVTRFFSYRSNKMLSPALMGDNMIGMPGVDGKDYDGFTIITTDADGNKTPKPQPVRSLKTIGKSGFAIPMANLNGDIPKFQIAADPSKINVELKAKAADGISFKKSEYLAKNGTYTFTFNDGTPTNLKISKVSATTGEITFLDAKGEFTAHMKDDVLSTLKERDYNVYEGVATLKVISSSKYIWPSKGTLTGSTDEVTKTVSPSNPGFIVAREPQNESDKYTVVVAEGALKGHIVAKYMNVVDRNGKTFGNEITYDDGVIVAQVPGVARAFVEGVKPVYEKYNVGKTYIAMDADGRDNKAVARGIKAAYECLQEATDNVEVMSWNPEQKGLDDALLAVAQGRITLDDMGITFGTPEELFPLDKASDKFPYLFDGSQTKKAEWQSDYTESHKEQNAKLQQMQAETAQRQNTPAPSSLVSIGRILNKLGDRYTSEDKDKPMSFDDAINQLQADMQKLKQENITSTTTSPSESIATNSNDTSKTSTDDKGKGDDGITL